MAASIHRYIGHALCSMIALTKLQGVYTCTTTIDQEGGEKEDTVDIQPRQALPVPLTLAGWSQQVLAKSPYASGWRPCGAERRV